jgi:hypothetical protein
MSLNASSTFAPAAAGANATSAAKWQEVLALLDDLTAEFVRVGDEQYIAEIHAAQMHYRAVAAQQAALSAAAVQGAQDELDAAKENCETAEQALAAARDSRTALLRARERAVSEKQSKERALAAEESRSAAVDLAITDKSAALSSIQEEDNALRTQLLSTLALYKKLGCIVWDDAAQLSVAQGAAAIQSDGDDATPISGTMNLHKRIRPFQLSGSSHHARVQQMWDTLWTATNATESS